MFLMSSINYMYIRNSLPRVSLMTSLTSRNYMFIKNSLPRVSSLTSMSHNMSVMTSLPSMSHNMSPMTYLTSIIYMYSKNFLPSMSQRLIIATSTLVVVM